MHVVVVTLLTGADMPVATAIYFAAGTAVAKDCVVVVTLLPEIFHTVATFFNLANGVATIARHRVVVVALLTLAGADMPVATVIFFAT